jgi:hypothetical protein
MGHAEAPKNYPWRNVIHRRARLIVSAVTTGAATTSRSPAVVGQWPDNLRLDLEPRFVCGRGANISGDNPPVRMAIG